MFTRTDEWVRFVDEHTALVGISENARNMIGKVDYIDLPAVGDKVKAGELIASAECAISEGKIYSPFDGVISEVNESLKKHPEQLSDNPFGTWIVKISNTSGSNILLSYEEYREEINS